MKEKRFEILIIVGIIVFSLLIFIVYMLYDKYIENKSYVLVLSPYSVFDCKKWDCENKSSELLDYNNKSYNIFIDGKYYGKNDFYYNNKSDKYYVFDSNSDNFYESGRLFAYKGKAKISQIYYEENELVNEEINQLSKLLNYYVKSENVLKVTLDFDDDGSMESIYSVNNFENDLISCLVYNNDSDYVLIDKVKSDVSGFSYFSNVIDIFEDGKLEFVYTTRYSDMAGYCNRIFRLKGKKFVSVNECEVVGIYE